MFEAHRSGRPLPAGDLDGISLYPSDSNLGVTVSDRPGGPIASRPLRFYWVLDVSGSMEGEKIAQLNYAIREALPAMKDVAENQENASVEIRVLTFASGFRWMTPSTVPLGEFSWTDVTPGGVTDMGAALSEMAEELMPENMPARGMPPVVVLVTDGGPTDDFASGLKDFMAQPWGQRAVRLGIGVGTESDQTVLREFIDHPEIEPLPANNSADLVKFIRWASTEALKTASTPATQSVGDSEQSTQMDALPPPPSASSDPSALIW